MLALHEHACAHNFAHGQHWKAEGASAQEKDCTVLRAVLAARHSLRRSCGACEPQMGWDRLAQQQRACSQS